MSFANSAQIYDYFHLTQRRNTAQTCVLVMKFISNAFLSLITILALIFSGCAETKDGQTAQKQGTALGAVGGALIGGLIGYATGGGVEGLVVGAASGAVAGGVAGFAYGTEVAKRKAKYAKKEDWLNNEIVAARQTNTRAYAYNKTLRQRLAVLDRKCADARASHNRTALKDLKGQVAALSNEVKAENQNLTVASNDQKEILADKTAQTSANFAAYRQESDSYDRAKAERGQLVNRLASLQNSLDR
jgi:hypothetical protein